MPVSAFDGWLRSLPPGERRRQAEWVLRAALRAYSDRFDVSPKDVSPAALLEPEVAGWLVDAPVRTGPPGPGTRRARAQVLRSLADHFALPSPVSLPAPVYRPAAARAGARWLVDSLYRVPQSSARLLRTAAMVAVLERSPLRPVEMCALTLRDVTGNAQLAVVTTPSGQAVLGPSRAPLLMAWLHTREQIVGRLQGGDVAALWVSVRGNHSSTGTLRPAGLPVHPRGLERAFSAAVTWAYEHPASPVPVDGRVPASWEELRQALHG